MVIGTQPKDFLLAVEGLTVSFDGFKAVNDLSFYIDENEIRAVAIEKLHRFLIHANHIHFLARAKANLFEVARFHVPHFCLHERAQVTGRPMCVFLD